LDRQQVELIFFFKSGMQKNGGSVIGGLGCQQLPGPNSSRWF
jgi:hypothetical protein